MFYRTIGEGQPLVLIHGLGQTGDAWKLQEELSEYFQLFIPTLRGHGTSPVTQNIALRYFAQDILSMLDENGIKSAHFCGLSLGGMIVQEIHSQAKKRVKSMILANTTSYVPGLLAELVLQDQERSLNRLSDEDYIKKIALNSLYRPSDETIHHALQTFHLNRETYIQTARATQGINYLMMLTFTKVPIQIISSSHDYVTPYLYNAYVTQWWARKAKLTLLNQTGHLSNIQKPAQFNSIVKTFIEKC